MYVEINPHATADVILCKANNKPLSQFLGHPPAHQSISSTLQSTDH